jgi:hypothetical protein
VQHHGAVFADRVKHHRFGALGDYFAHDVNAFGLQTLQMRKARRAKRFRLWGAVGRHCATL